MEGKLIYDPKELESRIDEFRLQNDWNRITPLLERYARIFDAGTVTSDLIGMKSKSYYWTVSSELALYANKDVERASHCLTKAAEFNADNIEWRIILAKVVLERFKELITGGEISVTTPFTPQNETKENSFHEAMQSMKEEEKKSIQLSLSYFTSFQKHGLLLSISTLPTVDVVNILQEYLSEIKRLHLNPNHPKMKIQWVYLICKRALLPIRLLDSYNSFLLSEISEYSMWLQLDAVSTRALIYEECQSLHQARIDLQLITRLIKSFPGPIEQMANSCRQIVLFAACRLPLLETRLQMYSEALASYRLCVSGDKLIPAPLSLHYSIPIQIILSTTAAELILTRAYMAKLENNSLNESSSSSSTTIKLPQNLPEEDIIQFETALNLLLHAKQLMSNHINLTSNSHLMGDNEFSFPPSSMQKIIPQWANQHQHLFKHLTSSRIAVSLVAVEVYLQYLRKTSPISISDPLLIIQILEWGLQSDPRPTLELLWNLGVSYAFLGGRIDEGVDIMRQCTPLAVQLTEEVSKLAPLPGQSHSYSHSYSQSYSYSTNTVSNDDFDLYHRRHLLTWLGLGPQPGYELQHLPSLLASQISLTVLGNPEKALLCAHEGLQELFANHENYFEREMEKFINGKQSDLTEDLPTNPISSNQSTVESPRQSRGFGSFFTKQPSIYLSVTSPSKLSPKSAHEERQKKFFFESDIIETTDSPNINNFTNSVTSLVLILARGYAAWARNSSLIPSIGPDIITCFRKKSIGLFKFLVSQEFCSVLRLSPTAAKKVESLLSQSADSNSIKFPISSMDHLTFCLEYATVLAEIGDVSLAIELLRKYLVDMGHKGDNFSSDVAPHVSPVLHLLSILLTCTKGDEQVAIVGLQLCSEALCLSNSHQNHEKNDLTSFTSHHRQHHHHHHHNHHETNSYSLGEIAKSELLYYHLKIDLSSTSNLQSKLFQSSLIEMLNIKYTLARIKWSMGEKDTALRLLDDVIAPLLHKSHDQENIKSLGPFSFINLQVRVKLLVGASQLYRYVNNQIKSHVCVEEAWKYLFSFSPSIDDPRLNSQNLKYTGQPGHHDIMTLLSNKHIQRPMTVLESNRSMKIPIHTDNRWLDMLRRIPTIPGWKLSEGCGWGATLPLQSLADVLAECAEIVRLEGKIDAALELLQIAVSLYPQHVHSLLCLAEIEYSLHEESITTMKKDTQSTTNSQINNNQFTHHLLEAYQHAQLAVNYNKLNPHAWYVLGTCLQGFGAVEKAADAYVTSLECQQYLPIRNFSDVLF